LISVCYLASLMLALGGGATWLSALVCSTLSIYWFLHFWRFRRRTGLVHASRFIGGIGFCVILTMVSLILLQLWLFRPPVHWQSMGVWAFILITLLIIPMGVLVPPAIMQSQIGEEVANEASAYAARWATVERMRYRDTLLLRIPDVSRVPAKSHLSGIK
jgi:hypothetical protein